MNRVDTKLNVLPLSYLTASPNSLSFLLLNGSSMGAICAIQLEHNLNVQYREVCSCSVKKQVK